MSWSRCGSEMRRRETRHVSVSCGLSRVRLDPSLELDLTPMYTKHHLQTLKKNGGHALIPGHALQGLDQNDWKVNCSVEFNRSTPNFTKLIIGSVPSF